MLLSSYLPIRHSDKFFISNSNKLMKKCIAIITLAWLMVMATGCGDSAVRNLKRQAEAVNKECPQSNEMGTLTAVRYEEKENIVEFDYSIDSRELSIDMEVLKANPEVTSNNMKLMLSSGAGREMLKDIVAAGAGLRLQYRDRSSAQNLILNFTPAELKEVYDHPVETDKIDSLRLANEIFILNAQSPVEIDEVTTLIKVIDDGKDVVYDYKVDDVSSSEGYVFDFEAVRANAATLKDEMAEDFRHDSMMGKMVSLLEATGHGLTYRYTPESGNSPLEVHFTPAELHDL